MRVASPSPPVDSAERLVFFTDAIAAIALTLLVLPLVDVVPQARRSGLSLRQLGRENVAQVGAFVLSFVVIFRFWWAHHQVFRHVSSISGPLVGWSAVWTLSIVFLPVPTVVISAYPTSAATVLLYCGTLVVTGGSLAMLVLTVSRDPRLGVGRTPLPASSVLGTFLVFGAQVLAAVVGTVFPHPVGFWALTLMLLASPVQAVVDRRRARHPRGVSEPR